MKEVFEREAALKFSKEVAKLALEKNLTIREAEEIVIKKHVTEEMKAWADRNGIDERLLNDEL